MAIHESMSKGKWKELSFAEQMGNIGSEVTRARSADERGDVERRNSSIERALELVDLTIADQTQESRTDELRKLTTTLKEIRDGLHDVHLRSLEQYFLPFALLARQNT
jgi:hypothetical protein